ncbi:MAG: hypothetical protein K5662_00665 [Lachnospiraceae bacterium]|nr:hypothetical protein [Lachnospiraceae bacterium]
MNLLKFATRLPFLTSVIILCFLVFYNNKKEERNRRKSYNEFWDRESKANSTRVKPLDSIDFITIPYDDLPLDCCPEDEEIAGYIQELTELREERIANFTGMSNTDLKLAYGTANITVLSDADRRFTSLCRILANWADRLHKLGHDDEALKVIDFALDIRSDVSSIYYLAASIYEERGTVELISSLVEKAGELNSMSGPIIVRHLKESC